MSSRKDFFKCKILCYKTIDEAKSALLFLNNKYKHTRVIINFIFKAIGLKFFHYDYYNLRKNNSNAIRTFTSIPI